MLAGKRGLLDITLGPDRELVRSEVSGSVLELTPLEMVYRMQTKSGASV